MLPKTLSVQSKSNQMLKMKEEEFKMNLDYYNSKRFQQPLLYDNRQTQFYKLAEQYKPSLKGFKDDKLVITNKGRDQSASELEIDKKKLIDSSAHDVNPTDVNPLDK
mmetsp:Transcript_9919/g.11141  ORF Transcript_9919/g.11141 Transcript_9919/m.11141 type:complete len:107 (-) Transcript_9919:761-1081(-)